jgi:hypothetical protein
MVTLDALYRSTEAKRPRAGGRLAVDTSHKLHEGLRRVACYKPITSCLPKRSYEVDWAAFFNRSAFINKFDIDYIHT